MCIPHPRTVTLHRVADHAFGYLVSREMATDMTDSIYVRRKWSHGTQGTQLWVVRCPCLAAATMSLSSHPGESQTLAPRSARSETGVLGPTGTAPAGRQYPRPGPGWLQSHGFTSDVSEERPPYQVSRWSKERKPGSGAYRHRGIGQTLRHAAYLGEENRPDYMGSWS